MHASQRQTSFSSHNWHNQARANSQASGLDLKSAYTMLLRAYFRMRSIKATKIPGNESGEKERANG